jgi:hypothetical protein
MTNPTGAPAVNGSQRPPATPPPNPKQQAVTFALELAKIRATLPGASANRGTDVKQLIAEPCPATDFERQTGSCLGLPFLVGPLLLNRETSAAVRTENWRCALNVALACISLRRMQHLS